MIYFDNEIKIGTICKINENKSYSITIKKEKNYNNINIYNKYIFLKNVNFLLVIF